MAKKQMRHHEARTTDFLLTGKAICGQCGKPMVGDSGTSKTGTTHYYYTCQAKKRRAGCQKASVRKEYLEDKVIDFLFDHCLTGEMMDAIADAVVNAQNESVASSPLPAMEAELRDALKRQDNINDAIAEGIWNASTKSKLDELAVTIKDLEESISVLKYSMGKLQDRDTMIRYLKRLAAEDRTDPVHRQHVINTFLNAVYVYDDRLQIVINAVEGNSSVPLAPEDLDPGPGSDNNSDALPTRFHPNSQTMIFTVML